MPPAPWRPRRRRARPQLAEEAERGQAGVGGRLPPAEARRGAAGGRLRLPAGAGRGARGGGGGCRLLPSTAASMSAVHRSEHVCRPPQRACLPPQSPQLLAAAACRRQHLCDDASCCSSPVPAVGGHRSSALCGGRRPPPPQPPRQHGERHLQVCMLLHARRLGGSRARARGGGGELRAADLLHGQAWLPTVAGPLQLRWTFLPRTHLLCPPIPSPPPLQVPGVGD